MKPPQIQSVPTIRTCARFVNRVSNNGTVILAVTSQNLMLSGGILASGANFGYPIHGFFKILRARLWSVPNSSTTFTQAPTIGVRWFNTVAGTLGDTNSQSSDTSLSTATPAFVDSVPPVGSAASFWSGPSTNTLFNIFTSNTTAVICDLHLDWKVNDNANGAVAGIATAVAMTVGNLYFPPLDGVATNLWVRQNLPAIN
jgi:hypothetical protein